MVSKEYDDSESDEEAFYGPQNHDHLNDDTPVMTSVKKIKKIKKAPKQQPKEKTEKKKRPRKSTKKAEKQTLLYESATRQAESIIKKMRRYYAQDIKAHLKGGLTNKKITYCKELQQALTNVYVAERFLDKNGLVELARWVTKPSQGTEPSLTIKKKVFDIAHHLDVREADSESSHRLMEILQKHKFSRVRQLRNLSIEIVEKWKKKFYGEEDE